MRKRKAVEELNKRLDGCSVVQDTDSKNTHFAKVGVSKRSVDLRLADSMLEAAEQVASEQEVGQYDALEELAKAAIDGYN